MNSRGKKIGILAKELLKYLRCKMLKLQIEEKIQGRWKGI